MRLDQMRLTHLTMGIRVVQRGFLVQRVNVANNSRHVRRITQRISTTGGLCATTSTTVLIAIRRNLPLVMIQPRNVTLLPQLIVTIKSVLCLTVVIRVLPAIVGMVVVGIFR